MIKRGVEWLLSVSFVLVAACGGSEAPARSPATAADPAPAAAPEAAADEPLSNEAPDEAPPTTSEVSGFQTGLPGCDAYIAAVERFIACDKIPPESRDATRQGLEAMKSAWGETSQMPPEARQAADDACRQAVDALKQGAVAMGCATAPPP